MIIKNDTAVNVYNKLLEEVSVNVFLLEHYNDGLPSIVNSCNLFSTSLKFQIHYLLGDKNLKLSRVHFH